MAFRIYTVHVNPSFTHPYEQAEFVKEGFSWNAFLFTGLWALYHRVWWQAAALIAYTGMMFVMFSDHTLSYRGLAVIDFGVHLYIGFEANEWLRKRLKRKGYLTADITSGDSKLRAEQRFFDRYFTTHAAAAL